MITGFTTDTTRRQTIPIRRPENAGHATTDVAAPTGASFCHDGQSPRSFFLRPGHIPFPHSSLIAKRRFRLRRSIRVSIPVAITSPACSKRICRRLAWSQTTAGSPHTTGDFYPWKEWRLVLEP
jgi:hypothetical protein